MPGKHEKSICSFTLTTAEEMKRCFYIFEDVYHFPMKQNRQTFSEISLLNETLDCLIPQVLL